MNTLLDNLATLNRGAFGAGTALLNTIYGAGGSSAGSTDPTRALQAAERNQPQDVKVTAAQPAVKAIIARFTRAVTGAKSMTALLGDPAFINVLLTANHMSDRIGSTALAIKALTSKLSDPRSLANTLTDTRWKTLAQTYNFSSTGLASLQKPATIAAIANAYVTATWQTSQDTLAPGLSNALAFRAQASTIGSVDQILGNPTIRTVVTTALGIPQQIAFQSLNAQEQAISTRIDITRFKDPKFVETFVQRYLIANSANVSSASTPDLTTLAVQGRGILA